MALSQVDIDLIDSHAELIAERVTEKVIAEVLKAHINACPHGRFLYGSRRLLIGIGIGIILVSVGSNAALAILFKVFL